jgi:hypothetical protein
LWGRYEVDDARRRNCSVSTTRCSPRNDDRGLIAPSLLSHRGVQRFLVANRRAIDRRDAVAVLDPPRPAAESASTSIT